MSRVAILAAALSALCLGVAAGSASAHSGHGSAAFAQFRDCMKAHGAPALGHHGHGAKPSADEIAAWKKAFAACRQLLPSRTAGRHGGGSWHGGTRPSAAQVAAFKDCMAKRGFTFKPGPGQRPNFRDKAVREAFKSALAACRPLLKAKPSA